MRFAPVLCLSALALLGACTNGQPDIATIQSDQAKVQLAVDEACGVVNAAAGAAAPFAAVPQVAGVLTFAWFIWQVESARRAAGEHPGGDG